MSMKAKRLIARLILALPLILIPASLLVAAAPAETEAGQALGLKYVGAGISIVGSTIGAGIALYGIGIGGSALLAENPNAFTQVLILAGLAEGVAVYGILIAFMILSA